MSAVPSAFTNDTGTSNTTFATTSKTWSASNVYLASAFAWISGGDLTTLTMTFAGGASIASQMTGTSTTKIFAFLFVGDGSTGTKNFVTSATVDRIHWCIDEVVGADSSGTVVQAVANTGGVGGPTATLATFSNAANTAWFCAGNNGGTSQTVEAGFTKTAENTAFFVLSNEYKVGNSDLTPSFSGPVADAWAGVAVEIKISGGGGGGSAWGPQIAMQLNRIVQGN